MSREFYGEAIPKSINLRCNNMVVDGTATVGGSPIVAPVSTVVLGSVSGPWGGPQPVTLDFVILGSLVFMTVSGVDAVASVVTYITGPTLAAQYRPLSEVNIPFSCFDNGIFSTGVFNVNNDGTTYFSAAGNNDFSGAGATGFSTQTFTWTTTA